MSRPDRYYYRDVGVPDSSPSKYPFWIFDRLGPGGRDEIPVVKTYDPDIARRVVDALNHTPEEKVK